MEGGYIERMVRTMRYSKPEVNLWIIFLYWWISELLSLLLTSLSSVSEFQKPIARASNFAKTSKTALEIFTRGTDKGLPREITLPEIGIVGVSELYRKRTCQVNDYITRTNTSQHVGKYLKFKVDPLLLTQ